MPAQAAKLKQTSNYIYPVTNDISHVIGYKSLMKGGESMTKNKPGLGSDNIDPTTKHNIQSQGGQASSSKQDMSQLGHKGGQAAQSSGNAHQLTDKDRSQGGKTSSSQQDMSELGQKGGSAAHPKGRGLENADQETREEVARMGGQSSHGGGRKSE